MFIIRLVLVFTLCGVVFGSLNAGGLRTKKFGFSLFGDNGGNSSILQSEMRFAESRGVKVAKFAAPLAGGKKVLFIVDQSCTQGELGRRVVGAIRKHCGGKLVLDSIPAPKDAADNGIPVEEYMRAIDMDALLDKHTDAAVVITNIGLPTDARKMKYFKTPADKRAKLILLNSGFVDKFDFVKHIKNGDISAIVVTAPKVKYDVKAPRDYDKAFDIRYILVTKDNVEQYKGQLPN